MKKSTLQLIIFLFLSQFTYGQWPLRDTVEFQVRQGLPNFFGKATQGKETHVGYLGGSITDGDFWRPEAVQWMKNYFPNDSIIDHNVALGGSNSKYTAFRLDHEVLSRFDFDLIFIEFAVNDNFYAADPLIERSIEGIIRKIWLTNPHTDICFVFTVMDTDLPDISNGKMNLTASKHDSIAAHYGIPSIFWGVDCFKQISTDSVVFYDATVNLTTSLNSLGQHVYTKDKKHPTNYGSQAYSRVLANSFIAMEHINQALTHQLGESIVDNNYTRANMYPVDNTKNTGFDLINVLGARPEIDPFLVNGKEFLSSENNADRYDFSFEGSEIGISFLTGPSAGKFIIEVDGIKKEFTAFDGYSQHWRPQYRFFELACGLHQVRIYPSPNRLTLAQKEDILIADYRKNHLRNNPALYDHNELIFSDVLLFESPNMPAISVNGNLTFCAGDSVQLVSSEAWNNTWSSGENQAAIWVKNSGTYTVVNQVGSCSKTSSPQTVTVNQASPLNLESISHPSTCGGNNGSIKLLGSGSGTLSWYSATQSSSISSSLPYTISNLPAGNYVIHFNNGLCSSDSLIVQLNDPIYPSVPTISVSGNTIFCAGDSVILTSSANTNNTWSTGETTKQITIHESALVSVSITISGCTSSSASLSLTKKPMPPTPTITAVGALSFCAGDSVLLRSSADVDNTWSTGETSKQITVKETSNVSVYVNNQGCTSTSSPVQITKTPYPQTPIITASGSTTFCAGDSVILTSSAATNNSWSTGENTKQISVRESNVISVSVTISGCTSSSASLSLTKKPMPPTPTITAVGALTFCAGDSVILQASGSNVLWSTGSTSSTIVVKNSGAYSVNDILNGCIATSPSTEVRQVMYPTKPIITANSSLEFCQGDSVVLTSSYPSGNLWSTGVTSASVTVKNNATVWVQVAQEMCVSKSNEVQLIVHDLPVLDFISRTEPSICGAADGQIKVNANKSGELFWSGQQTDSQVQSNFPANLTGFTAGSYHIYLDDGNCKSVTVHVSLNDPGAPPTPSIDVTGDLEFCMGDSVQLTSSSLSNNLWSTGETSSEIWVKNSQQVSVSVSQLGCFATSPSIQVIAKAMPLPPTITATGSPEFCAGDSLVLLASTPSNITWSTGETTPSITLKESASITVSHTENGCTSTSDALNLVKHDFPAVPSITASAPLEFCAGDSIILQASTPTNITWSTGETSPSITLKESASVTVSYTENGCTSTSDALNLVKHDFPAVPSITASVPLEFCAGDSLVLLASTPTNITWSTGETSPSITLKESASVTVSHTENGCTSTSDVLNVVKHDFPAIPTIIASAPLEFCAGDSVVLQASTPTNITWSTDETSPSITIFNSGFVTLTHDEHGCKSISDTLFFIAHAYPSTQLTFMDSLCEGKQVALSNQGTPLGGIFTYNGVETNLLDSESIGIGTHQLTYTYTGAGCSSSSSIDFEIVACSDNSNGSNQLNNIVFELYPNPSTGMVFIRGDRSQEIKRILVFDPIGRLLKVSELKNQVDLSSFARGNYVLLLEGHEFIHKMKLVLINN